MKKQIHIFGFIFLVFVISISAAFMNLKVALADSSCDYDGESHENNGSYAFFKTNSSDQCWADDNVQVRTCVNGSFNGDSEYKYMHCVPQRTMRVGTDCAFSSLKIDPTQYLMNGQSRTFYKDANIGCDIKSNKEVHRCDNGIWKSASPGQPYDNEMKYPWCKLEEIVKSEEETENIENNEDAKNTRESANYLETDENEIIEEEGIIYNRYISEEMRNSIRNNTFDTGTFRSGIIKAKINIDAVQNISAKILNKEFTLEDLYKDLSQIFGNASRKSTLDWEWDGYNMEYTFYVPEGEEMFWYVYFVNPRQSKFFHEMFYDVRFVLKNPIQKTLKTIKKSVRFMTTVDHDIADFPDQPPFDTSEVSPSIQFTGLPKFIDGIEQGTEDVIVGSIEFLDNRSVLKGIQLWSAKNLRNTEITVFPCSDLGIKSTSTVKILGDCFDIDTHLGNYEITEYIVIPKTIFETIDDKDLRYENFRLMKHDGSSVEPNDQYSNFLNPSRNKDLYFSLYGKFGGYYYLTYHVNNIDK